MAKEKINFEDEQVRLCYRHTTSHILAQAVKKLWPEAKLAIGPAIDNGFYYDFDLEHKFTDQDLLKIQKEMKKIVQERELNNSPDLLHDLIHHLIPRCFFRFHKLLDARLYMNPTISITSSSVISS